jgi:hypothetical protein
MNAENTKLVLLTLQYLVEILVLEKENLLQCVEDKNKYGKKSNQLWKNTAEV